MMPRPCLLFFLFAVPGPCHDGIELRPVTGPKRLTQLLLIGAFLGPQLCNGFLPLGLGSHTLYPLRLGLCPVYAGLKVL